MIEITVNQFRRFYDFEVSHQNRNNDISFITLSHAVSTSEYIVLINDDSFIIFMCDESLMSSDTSTDDGYLFRLLPFIMIISSLK